MRAAYVCADPGVPVFGCKGCSVHVQEVIRTLIKQSVGVTLFAARLGGDPPSDLPGLDTVSLRSKHKRDPAERERAALEVNQELSNLLERHGPFDFIYERYSLWSWAGMSYAAQATIPGILEVNAPLIEEQAKHRDLFDRESAETVAGKVFKTASVLIGVSHEVAAYLETFPAARGRVKVVPNGVDVKRFRPGLKPAGPVHPGKFTIGFVGSMKPWHGLSTLVEAFRLFHRKNPESRLLAVGDGMARPQMEAEVAERKLQDVVHFAGTVEPHEVPELLASMDVAVAPYPRLPDFYFSPLKVLEYMGAGLAIVASRIGMLAELIEDEVNGLLVPPEDPAALARALERLHQDPAMRGRVARAARAAVVKSHTWDDVVKEILYLAGVGPDARPVIRVLKRGT